MATKNQYKNTKFLMKKKTLHNWIERSTFYGDLLFAEIKNEWSDNEYFVCQIFTNMQKVV